MKLLLLWPVGSTLSTIHVWLIGYFWTPLNPTCSSWPWGLCCQPQQNFASMSNVSVSAPARCFEPVQWMVLRWCEVIGGWFDVVIEVRRLYIRVSSIGLQHSTDLTQITTSSSCSTSSIPLRTSDKNGITSFVTWYSRSAWMHNVRCSRSSPSCQLLTYASAAKSL